jgi:hypothetical protein
MAQQTPRPAPKLHATPVPPAEHAKSEHEHEERQIDEAVDESFPASDPPAIQSPSSTLAVKKAAEKGREVPEAECPDSDMRQGGHVDTKGTKEH